MSRELCDRCDDIVSTTASPNSNEGYFVSDEMGEDIEIEGLVRWWYGEMKEREALRIVLCTECKDTIRSRRPR